MTSGICTASTRVPRTKYSPADESVCVALLMAKGLISTGSSRRLVGSLGEYFEIEEEAKVAIGAAHRRGAADGVTPAVHGETGLDQGAFDCLFVNSFAGVILPPVAGAYHGSAVGGVAGCAGFSNAAGAGRKENDRG